MDSNSDCIQAYRYQGLILHSEFPLPALEASRLNAPNDVPADLRIRRGPFGSVLTDMGGGWLKGDRAWGFDLPRTGRFVAVGGQEIYVAPAANADEAEVELLVLGSGFAISQMQRSRFCLHSATLRCGDLTVAFCGDSGEGKSTLALALALADWETLTDDLVRVERGPKGYRAHNNGRHLRLWAASLEVLGYSTEGLARVAVDEDKYYLASPSTLRDDAVRLDTIVILESGQPESDFALSRLSGVQGLAALRRHTYRHELLSKLDCDGPHLQFCCDLLSAVPLLRFRRPRSLARLAEVDAFLRAELPIAISEARAVGRS